MHERRPGRPESLSGFLRRQCRRQHAHSHGCGSARRLRPNISETAVPRGQRGGGDSRSGPLALLFGFARDGGSASVPAIRRAPRPKVM